MDKRAKVEQAVFDFLRPRLKRHREEATELARLTASSVAKVNQHAQDVVAERRRQLQRAEEELDSCLCQEDADCSGYRRRVEAARRALEHAIQGREIVQQASTQFRQRQTKYTTVVDQQLFRAEKIVRLADERTINYQKASQYIPTTTLMPASPLGGPSTPATISSLPPLGHESAGGSVQIADGGGDGGSGSSWTDLPGVRVPAHFPDGFAEIPLSLIVDDNPVKSAADFDAGQDLAQLRWSAEALLDVVLPAMESPGALQYLKDRDLRENLAGGRSYSATYSGFFAPGDAIRVSPSGNGTFDLVNGRHRIWLLARAGATHVPAVVTGGHQ